MPRRIRAPSRQGSIEYHVTPDFLVRVSIDRAYRFPTVAEMFQAISTPNTVITNNPNLQPESTTYYDLTAEYHCITPSTARSA